MLEHVLNRMLEQGWSINKVNDEWIYAFDPKTSSSLMFTTMSDANDKLNPPLQNLSDLSKVDIIVLCPEGFNSLFLKNISLRGVQLFFWDIQSGNLFPYPPTKNKSIIRIKNILEGKIEPEVHKPSTVQKSIPVVTYTLLSIFVIVFILMTFSGGTTNVNVLIKFGAKVNSLISNGQFWRLFTSIFIHIGRIHLLFNSYAMWVLGPYVESLFGRIPLLLIFLVSGIGGSLSSFVFSTSISAGASGGIYGLLGALLVYSIKHPKLWKAGLGKNIMVIIALNIVFGLFQQGIDNYAHIGGLLSGLIISWIVLALKSAQNA